jgi:large subunit ribosomal protein L29
MANKRAQELGDMSSDDLMDELAHVQTDLLNLRFQYATHQNTNYARISMVKRDVARIKSIVRERELEEAGV